MKWPLAVPSMTALDKLKIGYWLLTNDHWSAGAEVRRYEEMWEQYTGCPHAVMVSSGSAANFLIAQRLKEELERSGQWKRNRTVLFPAVNWISSISPFVQQGFDPVFMDVSSNMCSSSDQVHAAIRKYNPVAVFYTTLLGFSGDLGNIRDACNKAHIPLYLDNCESSFSTFLENPWRDVKKRHCCNMVTSSTSIYFSHHTSGNQEGGFIFCQDEDEANWYRMARNHGMTRGMPKRYLNPNVDSRFDFYLMGSNHRSTNLAAYMASLDFERALVFRHTRQYLASVFSESLDENRYERPHRHINGEVPLVLPIVAKQSGHIHKVKDLLTRLGVESRPIVGGNMLRHTAFDGLGNPDDFPRAQHIHDNGVYIGLHKGVTEEMVRSLADSLNRL